MWLSEGKKGTGKREGGEKGKKKEGRGERNASSFTTWHKCDDRFQRKTLKGKRGGEGKKKKGERPIHHSPNRLSHTKSGLFKKENLKKSRRKGKRKKGEGGGGRLPFRRILYARSRRINGRVERKKGKNQ